MQTHIKLVHLKQKRNRSEKSGDLNVTAESLQIKLCIDPIDI